MSTHQSASLQVSRRSRGTTLFNGARLQDLLTKGTGSGESTLNPATVLSDMLPLPGLQEIRETARSLITKVQAMPQVQAECLALGKRLEHLTEIMKELAELDLEDFEHYKNQLDDVKRIFDKKTDSGHFVSRLNKASHKLEVLQDLDRRISSIIQVAQMDLLKRLVSNQEEEERFKTMLPQEITDQSDPSEHHQWFPNHNALCTGSDMYTSVISKHRSGNVGSLPVQYITYQSDRPGISRKIVKETLKSLLPLSHKHISSVVGKTSGSGCNGIIFRAGALTLAEFLPQVALRDAARCVLEYDSVVRYLRQDNYDSLVVGSVQVRDNGSIMVIPELRQDHSSSGYEFYNVLKTQNSHADPALQTLVPYLTTIIGRLEELGSEHTEFLQKLATSKVHWNELQALELASQHVGFFRDRIHITQWLGSAVPPFKLSVLDTASMSKGSPEGITLQLLESLEPVLLNSDTRFGVHSQLLDLDFLDVPKPYQTNSDGWVTYPQHPTRRRLILDWRLQDANEREIWSAFKQTARENASNLLIPLDSIYLCIHVAMLITIRQPGERSDTEELYFHRRPNRTSDPADFWGYFSTNPFVEHGAARTELERRGWNIQYHLGCGWHGMEDDWEYRYESLLEQLMGETPGGFVPSSQTSQARSIAKKRHGAFGIRAIISEVN